MVNVVAYPPVLEDVLAHYSPDFESDPKYTEDEAVFLAIVRAYTAPAPTGGYKGLRTDWEALYETSWGYPRVLKFCRDNNIPCGKAKAARVRDHLLYWQGRCFRIPDSDPPEFDYTRDFSAPPPHTLYPEEGW